MALQQELDEDVDEAEEAEEAEEAVPSTVPDQVIHQQVRQWATKAGCLCHCKGRNESCFDCSNDQHIELAAGFRRLSQEERAIYLRAVLHALTALPGIVHDLQQSPRPPKRRKDGASQPSREEVDGHMNEVGPYATSVYVIRGIRLCMGGCCAMMQISRATLWKYHSDVGHLSTFKPYKSGFYNSNRGSRANTLLVMEFLQAKAERDALYCPTGRGSRRNLPVQLLPSDTTKKAVHEEYKEAYPLLLAAYKQKLQEEGTRGRLPSNKPLHRKSFEQLWRQHFPHIRIAKPMTDLCDTCVTLKKQIAVCEDEGRNCDEVRASYIAHTERAVSERTLYKDCRTKAINDEANFLHLTFDFAEKVHLPRLQNQPGQIYYTTGLKVDLFGVYVANIDKQITYTGHWPMAKNANLVCSILHDALKDPRVACLPTRGTWCYMLITAPVKTRTNTSCLTWRGGSWSVSTTALSFTSWCPGTPKISATPISA